MDTSGVDYMKASLLSYMHSITNVVVTPPEPQKEYQIPMSDALDIMRSYSGDGSTSALYHLHLIEDRCMLFNLANISKEKVKWKVLYLSLDGDARILF
jgi:hypothetical protein